MILFAFYDLFTMKYTWWGWEKNPEIYTNENQGKNSPFWDLPSSRLRKWKPTVFRCPKTSRTYPRWDRCPSLVGKRNTGLGTVWVDRSREYDFYTCELSRSSNWTLVVVVVVLWWCFVLFVVVGVFFCCLLLLLLCLFCFCFFFFFFFFLSVCLFSCMVVMSLINLWRKDDPIYTK